MRIELPTLQGRFLRRYKRFFADVELDDGSVITAHCPNTGSMLGCLEEGRRAVLRDSLNLERKLRRTWRGRGNPLPGIGGVKRLGLGWRLWRWLFGCHGHCLAQQGSGSMILPGSRQRQQQPPRHCEPVVNSR